MDPAKSEVNAMPTRGRQFLLLIRHAWSSLWICRPLHDLHVLIDCSHGRSVTTAFLPFRKLILYIDFVN